jgi:hypothetical protein
MSFYSAMEEAQLRFEERVAHRHAVSRDRTKGIPSIAARTLVSAGLYRLASTVDAYPAGERSHS